ncbi:alpha/beta hydrolase [Streptomyces sp. NPDC049837]|uniref:alpha/beta hydrolase family protein n=1 Tax=Streptomyces sp. NPDC049837 TaxID=3155277 RepID=UPI00342DB36B
MRATFLAGATALAVAIAGLLPAASAGADARSTGPVPAGVVLPAAGLTLPVPTGKLPIGVTTVHLEEKGRADPWVAGEDRELMVSLWYPAVKPSGTPARYMTPEESATYLKSSGVELPPELLSTVTTHATVDATPVPSRAGLPLVVLSPGFGMPRATLTGLAEDLASRGYVVAGIGHNYEAHGTTFPDGRTTDCVACENPDFPKAGAVRAQDVSYVLDALAGGRPVGKGVRVDPGRVAMVGHSAGGFSTVPAMLTDTRIKAGVNMDGNFRYPNDTSMDRPLLMLGKPSHVPGGPDATWDETWGEFTGWKRWLTIDGTQHLSFTDLAPLGTQLGVPQQDLDGARCIAAVRAYVRAFLDTHLRGRHAPLLDGPSARYPEVRFHRP